MSLRSRRCGTKSSTSQSERIPLYFDEEANALYRWRQPVALYLTVVLCSVGAAVQGWDQTGSNGANLSFPVEFGIPDNDKTDPNYERNLWLVGLVNAAPYIASAFLGCWLSDPLNNYFGRRGTIFVCAVVCLLSVIGSGFTQNWYQLFICRLLLGIGKEFVHNFWFQRVLTEQRYGQQGLNRSNLRSRECAGSHSWWLGHVLANVYVHLLATLEPL